MAKQKQPRKRNRKPSRQSLRAARLKLQLGQGVLAARFDMQHTTVSRWEGGVSKPSDFDMRRWVAALHDEAVKQKDAALTKKFAA